MSSHPAPNNGVAQAQQIITQHAAGIQQHHPQHPALLQPQMVMAPMPAPASLAPVLAPAPAIVPAPAPLAAQPPVMAARGIPLPPAPAPLTYAQPATHIAPAPAVTAQRSAVNHGVPQQPNIAVTKRRRLDVPVMAMSGLPGTVPVLADPMAVAAALQGRGRKKTQAQIDRRRERNRILARRTRLRKKFFFESLQKEVVDLQRENNALKDIVRNELAEQGMELLEECNASEKLPPAVLEACGEHGADMDQQDFNLVRSIQQSQHSFVITDPSLNDNPIVFASDDFLNLTGYSREDVLGRNCRFLQGTDTSQSKVEEIRKGLATGDDVSVTLVNYTADGTPFWNKLFIAALRDAQNNIVNFIGVIVKVGSPDADDPEHGKSLPGEDSVDDGEMFLDDEEMDSSTAALVADGTVKAIEGVVDAAVAAAPSVVRG
jgi:PAS domain S-box-containing protein